MKQFKNSISSNAACGNRQLFKNNLLQQWPLTQVTNPKGIRIFIYLLTISVTLLTIGHGYQSAEAEDLDLDIWVHHSGQGIAEICLDSQRHEKDCNDYDLSEFVDPFVIAYEVEDPKPGKEFKICYELEESGQKDCKSSEFSKDYQETDLYLLNSEFINRDEHGEGDDGPSHGPEPIPDVTTYRNSQYNLKIDRPLNYETVEKDFDTSNRVIDIVTFFQPSESVSDDHQEYYSVVMDPIPYERSLSEYLIETTREYSSSYTDFKEIDSDTLSTLNGQSAYKLIYSYTNTDTDKKMKAMENGIIVDDEVYYLEYHAEIDKFDRNLSDMKRWMNSFQIL